MILNSEAILAAQDLRVETVEMPEWGGEVLVSEMSASRRMAFEKALEKVGDDAWMGRVVMTAFSCVDEEGKLVFTPEMIQALAEKNMRAILRITARAMRMQSQALAEARANFTPGQR